MKKIAFFIGSLNRGGAERVISILANHYAENGYQVDVIMLLDNIVGYELNKNVNVINYSGNGLSKVKRIPYWLKTIRKYVKEQKPDVLVSFCVRLNVFVLLASSGLKVKKIVSERNDPRTDGRGKFMDIMTKILYPKVNTVVFQTDRAKSYFNKLKNGVVIPNPITVPKNNKQPNPNKIVSVGNFRAVKNHKMLINAFHKFHKYNPNVVLNIYGDGELYDEIQNQINSFNLTTNVILHGSIPNVIEEIADASIFCLSSNSEGLSNALLEALALGIPCISTDVAGASEYIVDGESGFIVPVGDEDAFADRLNKLYNDKELLKQFSIKSKEMSKKCSFDTVISNWDEVILN